MSTAAEVRARFTRVGRLGMSPSLLLRIARTPEQLMRGLQGVVSLPPDTGMLFIFEKSRRHGFWMKDTPIALDLAWLTAGGAVQEIIQLNPYDETLRLPQQPVSYAVEVPAGWFASHDTRVGDVLRYMR